MEDAQEPGYSEMNNGVKRSVVVGSEVEFPSDRRRGVEGLHFIRALQEVHVANG